MMRTSAPASRARRMPAVVASTVSAATPRSTVSAPSARAQRSQRVAVGIDDLAGTGLRARHHQLVAGRQHRDLRAAAHRKFRIVHGGRQRQRAVGQAAAAGEQHLALTEVDPSRADVPPDAGGLRDRDVVAVDGGVLLDDHRVGAIGDHAAGEDPHRLAGADRPLERPAGGDFADHLEPGL
ncbi:hypothetical protein ACVIHI_002771 [Bradyrhizobium sp. USDA 4524]